MLNLAGWSPCLRLPYKPTCLLRLSSTWRNSTSIDRGSLNSREYVKWLVWEY